MYVKKTRGLGDVALTDSLANAIARFEGFFTPGSVAARNHNPGNLRSWGSYPVVGGYAQFPDDATGWAALQSQVSLNTARGLSLEEFFGGKPGVYGGYAPAADSNNPTNYANTVAGWLGIDASTPLASISPGSFRKVPPHSPAVEPKPKGKRA